MKVEPRRSKRLTGEKVDYVEVDEHDRLVRTSSGAQIEGDEEQGGLLDLMGELHAARPTDYPHPLATGHHFLTLACSLFNLTAVLFLFLGCCLQPVAAAATPGTLPSRTRCSTSSSSRFAATARAGAASTTALLASAATSAGEHLLEAEGRPMSSPTDCAVA